MMNRSIHHLSVASRVVTYGVTIHGSDYRLRTIGKCGPVTYKVRSQVRRVRVVLHFLDVGACKSIGFTHITQLRLVQMSLPAANAFSLPVMTMAPMDESALKFAKASFTSVIN